jgi:hypothetical protein
VRYVPEDHFEKGPFRTEGAFGFRSYTCTGCGKRFATWERLKAHHPECPHDINAHLAHMKAVGPPPEMTPEDVEMAKALALLLDAA